MLPFVLSWPWVMDAWAFNGKDVSGRGIGGELNVSDHHGVRRRLADFRGKAVLIYFGYTQCPDVCPTRLARMNDVLDLLGPDAKRVQVLWMTVDPERDTQQLLANYVPAFNPTFMGLRGSESETDRVTRAFGIEYQIVHYKDQILVDHFAFGYLIDPGANTRAVRLRDERGADRRGCQGDPESPVGKSEIATRLQHSRSP
ncbi:MAG TPA: SCO family protein [Burkholderiaceae bacterium]|nr:SCO family protein [Burkholderiaceae bacterium]